MRPVLSLLVLVACAWLTPAQEPKTEPKPQPKPPEKKADKPEKEVVPGRKTVKIEGFTFLLTEEAAGADASVYERKPLEVLEYECKLLTSMFSPKVVELLRRLTIFVDWDETVALSNGRTGIALASYYSGSAQQMVKEGRHALQSKTVTIHSLKKLTQQRQPKNDNRVSCLLLHEIAHAVHDQLFGFDHAGIKTAYEQAMERRLVEKSSYAATNHREFFAEMTCVYLDRLHYYPHTREDLKKHDPVTFKTMEGVWAGAGPAPKTAKAPLPHSEKQTLDLSLPGDVKFGPTVSGSEPSAERLKDKIVLIGYWGGEFTNVLSRLDRLHDELADYGLVTIGAHAYKKTPEEVKAAAAPREVKITVLDLSFVKDPEGKNFKSQPGGHVLLFDPTGKCIHRGSAYDVDDAVRAAVGKHVLMSALGTDEPAKGLKPVTDAFAAGVAPPGVLAKLAPLTNSTDEEVKAQAKRLSDYILAPGQKALADAQASAKTDPVAAFVAAERVAARFKNTALATKATALATNLRSDKAVAAELKARAIAAQVQQLANKLRAQEGSINPNETSFQNKNKALFDQIKAHLEQLRKQYPMARATAEAEKVAREFGIP